MSKMMSVFEKLNLVEKVNSGMNNPDVEEYNDNNKEEYAEEASEQVEDKADHYEDNNNNQLKQKENKFANNMNISEIYSLFNLENSNINTIFMLGNFINALPENLPYEVKNQTVMNIISASNTDLNRLITDGEKRLSALKQFSDNFYQNIQKSVSYYESEIAKLTELIEQYKKEIDNKTTMLQEQNHIVKYEAQKISSIIDFFTNGEK